MRGMFAPPRFRVIAARNRFDLYAIWLAFVIAFSCIFSGCASAPAEKSSPEPAAAKISVVPSVVDFNSVVVGQKNSQTVKIINTSTESVDLSSLLVSGTGFTLSNAKTPLTLPPGQNTNFSVVFAPSNSVAATGSLIIASPDLKSPVSIPLSGSGEKAAPQLQISPSSISFGSRSVNSSAFQSVTLTNTGNVALKISSVSDTSSEISVVGLAAGVSLSPDQKLVFQVWFRPSAAGNTSSTIAVASSSLSAPVNLSVSGSGSKTATPPPTNDSAHSVGLAWDASTSSVAGYHIYRGGSSGGPYNRISGSLVPSLTYKDTGVASGDHYYYVVTAVEADGTESAYSNEVAVDIPTN
jgi:hypothetical protein